VPRHGIGQQVQRTSSGSTPHDRITILQICPSRSLPFHRLRQSTLRYPAVDANRSPTRSVQRHLRLIRESLPLRPTRCIGPTPILHLIRGVQIPIVNAAPPTSPSRGFLPGRFADAGPPSARRHHHGGRHPQTFTQTDMPAQPRDFCCRGLNGPSQDKARGDSSRGTIVLVRASRFGPSSGNDCCSAGLAVEWIGSTTAFAAVVRKP
jgi:hypothetical protein